MDSRLLLRLKPVARRSISLKSISLPQRRGLSALQRKRPNYEGHIPLNIPEKIMLTFGSAIGSVLNPRRGGITFSNLSACDVSPGLTRTDLIAALGESTASPFFIYRLRDAMLASPTGRRILRDRPRISSRSLSMAALRALPTNSVGCTYARWLDREGVSPDTRADVRFIDDAECAYVMQRYRECHDFYHALTGLPIMVEGEIALKAFEFANTLIPMTGLSMFAIARLRPAERARFWSTYLPWAMGNGIKSEEIINVYWEEELEKDVDDLRKELGIEKPPDLRETRRILRAQHKARQLNANGI